MGALLSRPHPLPPVILSHLLAKKLLRPPPLPRHSPEQPIQMKIGTYPPLCTLKRIESQNHQKSLPWSRKWEWKGRLRLQSTSRGKIPEIWFFGPNSPGFDLRPKFLAHSSCNSMRRNFFAF